MRSLVQRDIDVPILIRFDGIMRSRVKRLHDAFAKAIEEAGYGGTYCGVFPIKVNQQRHVVDTLAARGKNLGSASR